MTKASALCLNMIVKNEMANLERCLAAVAPHIDCWVIGDTGSSDGTQDFIRAFFAERGVPGELHAFAFVNFEQARNEALRLAYASPLAFDYLLFDDADMELIVEDAGFRSKLTAPGYGLMQRSVGGLRYWNTRLARRDVGAWYHGVTHEYLDVPGGTEQLSGVWYRDHASGSNRVDKFERDARLLREALDKDPDNHRYWFYLAQSYQDAGRHQDAADAYARRAGMGGWDEEAWMARVRLARETLALGNEAGFVSTALAAYNQRPWRAEPLYDLARHYRLKGDNHTSALFGEQGLELPRPDGDILFVEDWVYQHGLREEYAIAANYARDPVRKSRGYDACNALALDRATPDGPRNLALSNLDFYIRPAVEVLPSFLTRQVGFEAPEGYRANNPSVVVRDGEILMVQRAVNYTLDLTAPHRDANRYATEGGQPIHTRNFLLQLDEDFAVQSSREILPPADLPEPAWRDVQGFEDLRPVVWRGELWCLGSARELSPEGFCEEVLARLDETDPATIRLAEWRVLRPAQAQTHEKNWMPFVDGDELRLVYGCDPTRILDDQAQVVAETEPPVHAESFRGGSQLIPFDGGWLAVVHETLVRAGQREYKHRFAWFDAAYRLGRVSLPFYFQTYNVEFAAGLAWAPDGQRLIMTYGAGDCEAWIASAEADDVRRVLDDVKAIPNGAFARGSGAAPSGPTPRSAQSSARHTPAGGGLSTPDWFRSFAPFLSAAESPRDRLVQSRAFDAPIASVLRPANTAALPQIHGFYEVLSEGRRHDALIASAASMRAAGHCVRIWSYAPEKLDFLREYGVELSSAAEVVPRDLYDRIMAGSEIRYFSDIFRYAVLYEHGGLWMDSDVVLLRPFPFHGDHFFNLQWRSGARDEHFVCGNVIHARPHSRHMRALYEMSLERFADGQGAAFGDVGPKLLSDYIASDAGADLRNQVFSPVFFNSIDWTEGDQFERPLAELADYLNDERVFGVHMWTARHAPRSGGERTKLLEMLSEPLASFPRLADLADGFNTDKNRRVGNRHGYARIYDQLLSSRRFSLRRLMEIGLCRGLAEGARAETPSADLWRAYFPFAEVVGLDKADFSGLDGDRLRTLVCDQSKPDALRKAAAQLDPASFDVIIDDGSHASYDQQLTVRELFPLLADGGWYFIENLDWQPPGEDPETIALTKDLLRDIQQNGAARRIDPLGLGVLAVQIAEIRFFDSQYELGRAGWTGGLVAIRKRGGSGLVG